MKLTAAISYREHIKKQLGGKFMDKSQKNKVSVIIPVYNGERFIEQCLNSVLNQTYENLEIICINDGSTDQSLKKLKEYAAKDDRVVVLSQENKGMSGARNSGMDIATGQYIAFVDCDDYIDVTMIEKLVDIANRTEAEIVITNILLFFEVTLQIKSFRDEPLYYSLRKTTFTLNQAPEMIKHVGVWDRIFQRDFIEKNKFRFIDKVTYEDAAFCIETEIKARKIALTPEHLYFYRKNAGGSITDKEKNNDNYKRDYIKVQRFIQEQLKQSDMNNEVWRAYLEYFFSYAIMHQKNATTFRFYRWFFRQVQSILAEQPKETTDLINDIKIKEYINYLKNNKLLQSYLKL